MNSLYTKYPWPTLLGGVGGGLFLAAWMFSYANYSNYLISDDALTNLAFAAIVGAIIACALGVWAYYSHRRLCNIALVHLTWREIAEELKFLSDSNRVIRPHPVKSKIGKSKAILAFSNSYGGVLTNSAAKSAARLESVAIALQHRFRFESVYIDRDMPGYVRFIFSDEAGGL